MSDPPAPGPPAPPAEGASNCFSGLAGGRSVSSPQAPSVLLSALAGAWRCEAVRVHTMPAGGLAVQLLGLVDACAGLVASVAGAGVVNATLGGTTTPAAEASHAAQ